MVRAVTSPTGGLAMTSLAKAIAFGASGGRRRGRRTPRRPGVLDDYFVGVWTVVLVGLALLGLLLNAMDAAVTPASVLVVAFAIPVGHLAGWYLGETVTDGAVARAVSDGTDPWSASRLHGVLGWAASVVFAAACIVGT